MPRLVWVSARTNCPRQVTLWPRATRWFGVATIPTGWEVEQAQVRLELIDAAITAYRIAGEQDVAERLMGIRRLAAEKAERLAAEAQRDRPASE